MGKIWCKKVKDFYESYVAVEGKAFNIVETPDAMDVKNIINKYPQFV